MNDAIREKLIADMNSDTSSHDFGKDIIPVMLADNRKLIAYEFKGYWKDVGTVSSLWEANMDLLDDDKDPSLDLNDSGWKIYTQDTASLPQYIGPEAKIDRAYITQGCRVEGEVHHSVLFTNSKVAPGAKVIDSVLMPGAVVEAGAVVTRALVADDIIISAGAVVGSADSDDIALIAKNV